MPQRSMLEAIVFISIVSPRMAFVVMSEIATMQNVVKQHPSTCLVYRCNHQFLR